MSRNGRRIASLLSVVSAMLSAKPEPATGQAPRSFTSGYAGTIPPDPRHLARAFFDEPLVRSLIYKAESGPLPGERVAAVLKTTSVTVEDLVRLRLLKAARDSFSLGFAYFTAADQRLVAAVAGEVVPSLVQAYLRRCPQFADVLAQLRMDSVSTSRVAFALIGGFSLNWDGLRITKARGYRVPITVSGPGFHYSFWASEEVPELDHRGYYWGSSTFPTDQYDLSPNADYSFSSFRDPFSDPRMNFPDLLLMPANRMAPAIREAATAIGLVDDTSFGRRSAGVLGLRRGSELANILFALRETSSNVNRLAARTRIPPPTLAAELRLLQRAEYVSRDRNGRWSLAVPVLEGADSTVVSGVLALSELVLTEWLEEHYPTLRRRLHSLTAVRQGVPFEALFTQVWHELFGRTTKEMVRAGVVFDPRGGSVRYPGSLGVLWRRSLFPFDPG